VVRTLMEAPTAMITGCTTAAATTEAADLRTPWGLGDDGEGGPDGCGHDDEADDEVPGHHEQEREHGEGQGVGPGQGRDPHCCWFRLLRGRLLITRIAAVELLQPRSKIIRTM
jgi:hypothetical protein